MPIIVIFGCVREFLSDWYTACYLRIRIRIRTSSKTLRIHYLVGVSHFAECYDCMRDADKLPKIRYSAMVMEVDSDSESVSETGSPTAKSRS